MSARAKLLLSEAWRSLGANLSTTFAATITVLIGMFLLGLFIALGTWTVSWSNHVKKELVVKMYFKTYPNAATAKQKTAVYHELQQNPYVKPGGIVYISKEQAFRIMEKRSPDLTSGLTSNPLPDEYEVTPNKAENVDKLYASLTHPKPAGVDKVNDGKRTSHRILQVAHVIEAVFIVAAAILLVASVLLISNTIRLSIFSRRREIEVMKLVGATNWFVRGPFMVEGLLCGLAGSVLAVLLMFLARTVALSALSLHLSGDHDVKALAFPMTALILVAIGLGLGAVGSGLTIRRFLRI